MIGWLVLLALGAVTLLGLIFIGRLPRNLWQLVAAALVLAAAGYALQGRPDLPGSPAKALAAKSRTAEALIAMRADMDQTFSPARKWLIPADSFARDGDYKLSSAFIRSGLRESPRNADLWGALGLQLMLASDGQMSEPAKLAFARAHEIYPGHPATEYFRGLSDLFDGRVDLALTRWQALADRAPKSAKWKPRLESQIAGLKELARQAMEEQGVPTASPPKDIEK